MRLLPVLIGDKISNSADNDVWQPILQLQQMVEFICAPDISSGQIAYLKEMIEDLYFWYKLTVQFWATHSSVDTQIWEQAHIFQTLFEEVAQL